MGIDACIYFKATDKFEYVGQLPPNYSVREITSHDTLDRTVAGATHCVECPSRLYVPDYERGRWPTLCHVLMTLHACKQIKTVWYGGDDGGFGIEKCPPDRVLEISRHFMKHGNKDWG